MAPTTRPRRESSHAPSLCPSGTFGRRAPTRTAGKESAAASLPGRRPRPRPASGPKAGARQAAGHGTAPDESGGGDEHAELLDELRIGTPRVNLHRSGANLHLGSPRLSGWDWDREPSPAGSNGVGRASAPAELRGEGRYRGSGPLRGGPQAWEGQSPEWGGADREGGLSVRGPWRKQGPPGVAGGPATG
jgi:hypothetical protein